MRLRPIHLVVLVARLAAAQATDTTHRTPGVAVLGVVRDSIAHTTLAGAMVQLVGADGSARFGSTTVADSQGRFTIPDVPAGRYMIGFFHPMLDSLGIEPPPRVVVVDGRRPVRADLAIPSPARLRAAICGPRADSGGVVIGVVRDARDRAPATGITVTGTWSEVTLTRGSLTHRIQHAAAATGANGWFSLCNVPSVGMMTLLASRGADSTDIVEVEIPTDGFLRRELYLGAARTVVGDDSAHRADSLAPAPRLVRHGDGRLNGTVVTSAGGRPLDGAQVSIPDGPRTRANDRGEWTLADAPPGTRMLEVRAVGYYPDRRIVDVVAGAPPVRVVLSTMRAMLDTVRVRASRLVDRHQSGFEDRRRSGMGKYLTAADIARRDPIATTDMFRMVSGVRMNNGINRSLLVRGAVANWCVPAIYIDGAYFPGFGADELDDISPKEIANMEIHVGAFTPPQFQPGMSGCGAIVVWTK